MQVIELKWLLTDINLPPLMPDADNNFVGSLGNADVTCNSRIFRVTGANQNARKLLSHWFGKN